MTEIYIVVVTEGWIPQIPLVTTNATAAVVWAIDYSKGWSKKKMGAQETENQDELYFSQEEDGNMENSITVFQRQVDIRGI